jgi:hypothetical protein
MSQENGFDWELYRSQKFDSVSHPIIPVEIKSISGEWKIFYPLVDSGAIISVFNGSDCELLGYTLTDGEYFDIKGVLSGTTSSYIHQIPVKIKDIEIKLRIAFTTGSIHKQLLGRMDVFDNFRILFQGKLLKTFFTRE